MDNNRSSSDDRNDKIKNFHVNLDENKVNEVFSQINEIKSDINENRQINYENNDEIFSNDEKKTKKNKNEAKLINKENSSLFRVVWFVMIILISVLLSQYVLLGSYDMLAINKESNVVTLEIPKKASLNKVTNILYDNGLIKQKSFFKLYAKITKNAKKFQNGTFSVKTDMDYEAILNCIHSQENRTDTVNVTFPEGLNILECANLLQENGICDYQEFLDMCNSDDFDEDYEFIKNISNKDSRYYKLEGYLFPDTYEFYKDEDPKDTISRFLNNYEKKVIAKEEVDGYDEKVSLEDIANEKEIPMEQILTLASIIQEEAVDVDDMYMISSIFYNRLNTIETSGMNKYGEGGLDKLGSDVTVWYPYRTKEDVPSDLLSGYQSNYDTYTIKGLPAGPICNPGLNAIDAALNPKSTNYYYFCHSKDGKSYYAKTMSEHESNLELAGIKN